MRLGWARYSMFMLSYRKIYKVQREKVTKADPASGVGCTLFTPNGKPSFFKCICIVITKISRTIVELMLMTVNSGIFPC